MDRRGGTSFAILFILNPIVILFYQNCSVLPSQARQDHEPQRAISSTHVQPDCRVASVKHACAE